jgi:ribonucleotide monophosphatase NagD (HAD superfamily)
VGREAVVVGKPSHWLADRLVQKAGLDPVRTVVVGDRLDTDVMLGINGGTASVLVCTGCATLEEIGGVRAGDGRAPTYILSHVGKIAASADGNKAR